MTLMFVSACQQDMPTTQSAETPVETQAKATTPIESLVFDVTCSSENGTRPKSQLRAKLAELSALPDNYRLIDFGPLDLEQSIIFAPQPFVRREGPRLGDVPGYENLLTQITQASIGKIKGNVEWQPPSRIYRRATVEEYLFQTEDCAKAAEAYWNWVEDTRGSHAPLYKTIHGVVRNKQAIYLVTGGGMYMSDRQGELESVFRP